MYLSYISDLDFLMVILFVLMILKNLKIQTIGKTQENFVHTICNLNSCEFKNCEYCPNCEHNMFLEFSIHLFLCNPAQTRCIRYKRQYVIKFVSDLPQVGDFFHVLRFPPPIKLTAMI